MDFQRRRLLWLAACAAGFPFARIAKAQAYPSRPVPVIVPFAAGGPTDVFARLIALSLSRAFGQQFYVENQPGAGGNLGMAAGARATPDGYALTIVSTSFVVNPSLYTKIPYNPLKDFAPVTLAAASPNVLVVNPSIPATTVKELIAFLRSNPGKYSVAHPGVGTTSQLGSEMFRHSQDLDLVSVPFNGSAPAVQSVLAGHTPIAFAALTPVVPHVKEGKLRALAVSTSKRSLALPDVPTLAEAGFPDQEADTMQGVLAPTGTPEPIIAMLHREIDKAMAEPEVAQKMVVLGFEKIASTPDDFARRIRIDIPKWAKVIQMANIRVE
jgi:tripartite-type tricarboxylate transporter receptor subunit TctC